MLFSHLVIIFTRSSFSLGHHFRPFQGIGSPQCFAVLRIVANIDLEAYKITIYKSFQIGYQTRSYVCIYIYIYTYVSQCSSMQTNHVESSEIMLNHVKDHLNHSKPYHTPRKSLPTSFTARTSTVALSYSSLIFGGVVRLSFST